MNEIAENRIEQLMEAANRFALIEMDHLIKQHVIDDLGDARLNEVGYRLVIEFLFPILGEEHVAMLNEHCGVRRNCIAALNTVREGMEPREARLHELATRIAERQFMDSKKRVEESGMVEKMSPLQKLILAHEFFSIPFYD